MLPQEDSNTFRKFDQKLIIIITLSATISAILIYLINFKGTAVTWPSSDNLPAVCRMLDSKCLANDFFTNSSSSKTARLPFVYALSVLTKAVDNGIGGGLSALKAIVMALLPILMAFMIIISIHTHNYFINKSTQDNNYPPSIVLAAIFAPILIVLMNGKLGLLLSVAWWRPILLEGSAHNLSIILTLAGFLLINFNSIFIGALLILLGGIAHPAVGLFTATFSCILLCNQSLPKSTMRLLTVGLISSFISAILVKYIFDVNDGLNAQEFVKIYAMEAHPSHYIPSQFGALSKIKWYNSFLIVSGGLTMATAALHKLGNLAWKNSLLALASYLCAIGTQYLFVEIYPIKIVAALGPSRFTMFGPWLLLIFLFIGLTTYIDKNQILKNYIITLDLAVSKFHWKHAGYAGVPLLLLIFLYTGKSSSFNIPNDEGIDLVDFAVKNTNKLDVFALPFGVIRVNFPLTTGRAVFHGNGFPFSEKYFKEWYERHALIDGHNSKLEKYRGSWIGEKIANHYRTLTAHAFVNASKKYRLDWVVIESEFSNKFSNCEVIFETKKYKTFSMRALAECSE